MKAYIVKKQSYKDIQEAERLGCVGCYPINTTILVIPDNDLPQVIDLLTEQIFGPPPPTPQEQYAALTSQPQRIEFLARHLGLIS